MIARRKRTLDRQSIMAAVGMIVVAVFFIYDGKDHAKTINGLLAIVPWIIGLSTAIFLLNRWTLSIQSKLIRRSAQSTAPARKI